MIPLSPRNSVRSMTFRKRVMLSLDDRFPTGRDAHLECCEVTAESNGRWDNFLKIADKLQEFVPGHGLPRQFFINSESQEPIVEAQSQLSFPPTTLGASSDERMSAVLDGGTGA